jgi:multidrug efflux pump subunit AcrA (membrane-fusion protein)
MAAKIEAQIKRLEQRLKQLKIQKQRTQARAQVSAARKGRREELRRRILVGAVVLARVERGLLEESVMRGWLEEALARIDDRALFDLSPR